MHDKRYSEITLLMDKKQDETCVGLQKHTLKFVFLIYGHPTLSPRASKDCTNKHHKHLLNNVFLIHPRYPHCHRDTMEIILNTSIKKPHNSIIQSNREQTHDQYPSNL